MANRLHALSLRLVGCAPTTVHEISGAVEIMMEGDFDLSTTWRHFAAGYVSGFVTGIVEYPFDTLKVLQQTQGGRYSSVADCLMQTVRAHGFLGMYKGALAPLLGSMAENATVFFSYNALKRILGVNVTASEDETPTWKLLACGAGAGATVSFVLTPIELVKCRLQVQQGSDARFNAVRQTGPVACIRDIVRGHGWLHMWRGNTATMLREVPGSMVGFGVYELTCRLFMRPGQTKRDLHFGHFMSAGAASGVAYWSAFYPADTVKSKMQTDGAYAADSVRTAFRRAYAEAGIRGLYRGWGITTIRAAPVQALGFAVYESVASGLEA